MTGTVQVGGITFDRLTQPDLAWLVDADRAISVLARTGLAFTADDVTDLIGRAPTPNAVGARFRSAARSGVIVRVGARNSERRSRRGSLVAVWQGAPR